MQKSNPTWTSSSYESELATLEIDSNEILTLTLKPFEQSNSKHEQDLNLAISSSTYREPKLQLIDIRASWNTTQSDIRMLINQEALLIPYARAIVIPSEANPVSIQAILMLSKIVSYPIRFFTSKAIAYEWLLGFHNSLKPTILN